MQKMTILCTGKLKEKFYLDAVAEYVKRLSRFCKLEIIELPEERLPEDPSPCLQPHRLSHRQLLRNARILEAASRSAAVHVPHDLSPPPAAGNAFGADLPGLPDQRRKQIP